jgi:hypothetical protein
MRLRLFSRGFSGLGAKEPIVDNAAASWRALQAMHPSMKTLFVSGYTENTIIERGELKPGVAFLAKPFTIAQLSAKVREVLSGD